MFEGFIVDLINTYLGKYIQNLDQENLKVGIFSGNAELCNLQLRPEALFELDLPIEVKAGYVGRIYLEIPWTKLFTSPVLCTLEDVYILAGPVTDREYDPVRELALESAQKKKRLELLEQGSASTQNDSASQSFTQKLTATIINNIQVTVQRIHIRYEDKITNSDHPFGCGVMLKELRMETMNSQWKPEHVDAAASVVHKLLQVQSFSIYWNSYLSEQSLARNKMHTSAWRSQLKTSISTHRIGEEDFEFFLKPISTTARLILNKDEQNQIPFLVASILMEEFEILFSRQQFLSVLSVYELFRMMSVNQRYRKYKKTLEVKGHYGDWWKYAYTAICEEFIRPYSWRRIQEHRKKYRAYKNLYKKYLVKKDDRLKSDLADLESELDEVNIVMAREHAKLEIASESPNRVKKEKPAKGWFSWWWSRSVEDESDEEVVIAQDSPALNLPQWLNRLKPDEHQKLLRSIGYEREDAAQHSSEFISHKVVFNLQSCSCSLINYGKEILKVSLAQFALNLDNRAESNGFRASAKTDSFILEGVSVEHELVPIITSIIGVYAPSAVTQVFSLEFDKTPQHIEADFAMKLNIQPVEVVYDEHAVTEIFAFFQVPYITAKDVKAIAQAGFDHFARVSRAGLQYAIEQHKTLHLSVNMRSPYVVIPEYGTLHRGGNVVIFDLGKLKIESELQPKQTNLDECTMSEIESRLYDKFSITVTEVKMLLADSGEDWHTAQTKPESEFHVLPNFGLQLAFFNTVKSDFKQLPKHKLELKLSTLKINLSDEKLQMLADFFKHIPLPHSNSMMGLDDSVDGHIDPIIPAMEEKEVQFPLSFKELVHLRKVVRQNSALKPSALQSNTRQTSVHNAGANPDGNIVLDYCDGDAEEWTKNLDVKAVDDPTSSSNLVVIYARFVIGEVVVQASKVEDKIETPYLMMRIDRVCFDAALTTYGVVLQARLGGIQLVDKIHLGSSGEYLELLGFKTKTDLMTLVYRKVSADCPDFNAAYHSLLQGIVIKLSCLHVTFHREAVLFLNSFVQGLMQSIHGNLHSTLHKSNSTILSGPTNAEPYQPEVPSFINRLTQQDKGPSSVTKLHLVIKLNDLNVLMCSHEGDLIGLSIKDVEGRLIVKPLYTVMQARLRDFSVEDLMENTLYPRILYLDDDNAFDIKRVTFHNRQSQTNLNVNRSVDGSLNLRVGRIQGVFVYKLINEIENFLHPFANPELVESYKVAAQHAVYNKIQDMHDQGTSIDIVLNIHAPTILIPQHAESSNVIVVKLGDLRVQNCFEDSDIGQGVIQRWDHLSMNLDAMQIVRGKLNLNGNIEPVHTLVEPINLIVELKRALPPHRTDTHYDISGKLKSVKIQLTELDLRVLLSVLRDNLMEECETVTSSPDTDEADYNLALTCSQTDAMRRSSIETTTPVVEIEEPLLMAPEVMELVQMTKFSFDMEGTTILLYTEEDDPTAPSSPVHGDGEELARFSVEGITFSGMANNSGLIEVRLKLNQLTLIDVRPSSNLAIKRLVRSGLSDYRCFSVSPTPVIDISYRRNAEARRIVEITLDAIRVYVCVQYMVTIVNFFARPLAEFAGKNSSPPSPKDPDLPAVDPAGLQSPGDDAATSVSWAATVRARFKQLEVVLFAEPTNKHSRVLVLKTNASFDYSCLQERRNVDARIRQLQIISCIYGKTAQTTSIELYPCDMELTCFQESLNKELNVSVKVSEINLYISPATVHIFLDVVEILRQSGQRKRSENASDITHVGQHFDLWNVRTISAEHWLSIPETEALEYKKIVISEGPPMETLSIDIKKITMVLEIQEQKYCVPRLCLKTAVSAKVHDWSKQIYGKVDLPVEVLYYSEKLSVWEPLVEPVMEKEGSYRPWEVTIKLVRAESHPLSCTTVDLEFEKQDDVDGQIHEFWARHRARSEAESSESETDSETEMTVIKPKLSRMAPLSSHSSYDSVSRHSSIQGESDSEPEILNSFGTQLQSILSSDSSEGEAADEDGDAFEAEDQPVFLTAKGPISVLPDNGDGDVVDGVELSSNNNIINNGSKCRTSLCNYIVINSQDQFLVNINPVAMDIISEICESLQNKNNSSMMSVHDLHPFEVFNQLGVGVKMLVSADQKVYEDAVHNVALESPCEKQKQMFIDELDGVKLVDVDEDEIDGLMNLSKAIFAMSAQLAGVAMRYSPTGTEDDDDERTCQNDGRKIGRERMHVKVDGFDELCGISFRKASKQLYRLTPAKDEVDYCIACEVDIQHCRKVITLQSPLQIFNHLTIPVQICCDADELRKHAINFEANRDENQFVQITVLEPDRCYAVPLHIAYHCKLYIAPANMLYEKTSDPVWWQDFGLTKDTFKYFSCQPQTPNNNVFYFKIHWEEDQSTKRSLNIPRSTLNCTLRLSPSVVLHNLLPLNIHYSLEGSALSQLGPGDNIPLFTADLKKSPKLQLQVINYLNIDWTGSVELTSDLEEFKAINMEPDSNVEGQNKQMSLSIHMNQQMVMDLYVYSPYWIINKTGLPVQIRGSRSEAVYENSDNLDPLLFRFKKHRRKKAKLRVYNSKWARSFSLDTVGSSGVVICYDKERNRKYQFLLQVELSKLKLTKIVTIMPYFLVVNSTPYNLRYMEDNKQADLWMDLVPNECSPFWPATESPKMYVKYEDSAICSQHFPVDRPHKTVLRMEKGTALCTDVTVTETSIVIRILPYLPGDIPVRVDNLCEDVFLKLHQKKQSQVTLLSPNQSILYTWDDPSAERTLMWNVYNRRKPSYPAFINKDGSGQVQLSIQTVRRSSTVLSGSRRSLYEDRKSRNEKSETVSYDSSPDDDSDLEVGPKHIYLRQNTRTDKVIVYWVSYLDGIQRVLLLTQDERIVKKAVKMNEAEMAQTAIFLSLSGVGISLINSLREEVAYISLNSGTSIWEVQDKNRWKLLSKEIATWIEQQWQIDDAAKVFLEDIVEADLGEMEMKKPFNGKLRRSFNPALWLQFKRSAHNTYLQMKIHWVQIDNQLNDAYFATVLHPYRIPAYRYIVKKSSPKPCIELTIARRQVPECGLDTFKYVKLLVQEFCINLDKGFMMSVFDIIASRQTPKTESYLLGRDVNKATVSLADKVRVYDSSRASRSVYEFLHLSPIKVHVSLSLDGRPHMTVASIDSKSSVTSDIVDFFLNSVGAKLVDVKDVELRMAFFEREAVMLTFQQLTDLVFSHYKTQALQQAYVLLLGLDILGNPYGLVKDFTQGLGDFFYEPFLGLIHEPDKHAESLVQGIRSLMRHTVGGVAGSTSSFTRAIGKTLAFLSFDSEYQKTRQRRMLQHSNSFPHSLNLAGKSFMMGVCLGLSGVVLHPLQGAKEEGVEGFFKGIGKGLMGLITKPSGGVVDMVSMAFDGLRRSAEMGEDVVMRMRLPRYIHPLGLLPFSTYQSIGMKILHLVDHGNDIYCAHALLAKEEKSDIILITDKRVFLLKKCKGWREWSVDWAVLLSSLSEVPLVQDNKLVMRLKKSDEDSSWLIGESKELACPDTESLQWLQKKFSEAIKLHA